MGRFGLAILLSFGAALGLPERAAAQETAEALLQAAAEFYSGPDADPLAVRCARELLTEITVAHPTSDLAVAILLHEPLNGVDVADIEAKAGQIGTKTPAPENAGADPSGLSEDDLGLVFAWQHPNAFVQMCKRMPPELVGDIVSDLGFKMLAFGFRDIAPEFWDGALDELADASLQDIGSEAVTDHFSKEVAVWLLDRYADATGVEVDSEALVEIASPTARLIVAAATGSGPAAPALLAGTTAFSQARGAALSSYAEDERFALAVRGLIAADAYRRAAADLRAAGRADHAAEIKALAAAVIDEAAEAARASFAGSDGPLSEEMLRDMDEIVQLYRLADEETALTRLDALQARADNAAPGLFGLTTNNFYERYFMIGPQHAADSVRAYYMLHETLLKIFDDAPIIVAVDAAHSPDVAPLPSAPDPAASDPWQNLADLYADDLELRQQVADAADYAVLAWAGYGDPEAVALADRLGWDMLENRDPGGTLATRFSNRDSGEVVVSFRGSLPARQVPFRRDAFDDWVLTNALGSLDPFEMATDQLSGAAELAALITEGGQTVTFVGHSKGGRLAQIAHLVTGQAAYGFNSAPLGAYELRRWPYASRAMGPNLHRFRAPRELLTAPPALSAVEYDDSHTVPNAAHGHAIDSLALAMLAVAELNDTPDGRPAPDETSEGHWGADIVWSDWPEVGTCPRIDARECLAAAGIPAPALDFAFAVDPRSWGDVRATEFRDLGPVDLARLSVKYAPYEDTVLLNGSPDIIAPELTRDAPVAFRDATSQRIFDATPDPMLIYPMFTAYRLLPDGTQRFVQTESLMSGARATGAFAGAAVTYLDFPPSGGTPLRKPVAITNSMNLDRSAMTAASIRTNPAELQAALNTLGYRAGQVDGHPGPQTRTALMAFQADQCLPATGQPDPKTLAALRAADRFAAPCSGSRPPPDVTANAPLRSGVYVDDPSLCMRREVPYETVHLRQRIVRRASITWGIEGSCTSRRTDIRDGVTLFRGTCDEANQSNDARWRFDVQSNERFVDLEMFTAIPRDAAPRRFTRCSDGSTLRVALDDWFKDTPATSATEIGVTALSAPGCEKGSSAISGHEIATILNGRTLYGTNPETGIPWRWRFEGVAVGTTGRSTFSKGDAPREATVATVKIGDAQICESDPADGATYCETMHRCESDSSRMLFRSESGDWSVAEAIYSNADDPLEWQHGSPSLMPSSEPPAVGPNSDDPEALFRSAASEAFGPGATVSLDRVHLADSVAFFSARVVPAEPDKDPPKVYGQVVSRVVPADSPVDTPDEQVFEAILRREGSVWRVAQSRADPVANWWHPFCVGLEDFLGGACRPTAAVAAPAFEWPEPPLEFDVTPAASGDAELNAFLTEALPDWLVSTEVDYRIFPNGDGGRISVAGTLTLTKPTVEIAPGVPTLRAVARARGIVNDAFLYQALANLYDRPPPDRTNERHIQEYRVVTPAGTEIPFNAELPYIETVRAKKISGSLNYSLGGGEPLSAMPDHSYVPGDARFRSIVDAAMGRASRSQDRAIEKIEAFARHAPGGLIFATAQSEPIFEITFDQTIPASERLKQMRWNGGRPFGISHPGRFAVNWTGRVDVQRTINYSEPLVEGTSLRGAVSFYFTEDGSTLDQSSLTLFVNQDGTTFAVADKLRWDTELAGRGIFVEKRITSIGMAAWPK